MPGLAVPAMKPTVFYFPFRGRAEPIRLALAAKLGVEFEVQGIDYGEMKSNLELYPFAQCPRRVSTLLRPCSQPCLQEVPQLRYADDEVDICQSTTILHHIGRKHGMYGTGLKQAAAIDMIVDGVEAVKRKYLDLIYTDQLSEEAKAAYWTAHIDPTTTGGRNTGAHFAYLSKLVAKYGSGGWAVGSAVSIADATLYNMTDLHLRVWADKFAAEYPDLAAHHAQFAAIPGVKAYLDSPLCHAVANKNNLG
ncbi:hypothetical protein CHLNCDRAFT_57035 [Chlorella variabilis]|uniref:glutathione transferase n=1 Tax=Chlorella variabilis TaxID=554065 RepID=E1Z7I2_CHLVA|nr:hypothetical protein CHLNCDRAFT_57035 [Chlorella variabilis]EFN58174.1 hypothetical protein CHLNCDRAFT_57035 [Chlorella variabilis]|eukprot:XP_005850276.1 hypothetical protein CHLNCDRAFT_57035 [Chlorella variabilis]